MRESLIELAKCLHKRRAFVREHYGHVAASASTIGEGVYIFSEVLGTHEILWFVYCGLAVVWISHTIIIGLEE